MARINEERRIARVSVSTDLLIEALGFPEGTHLVGCAGERAGVGIVDLFVEHDDLPMINAYEHIPELEPSWAKIEKSPQDGLGHWLEFDWNLTE